MTKDRLQYGLSRRHAHGAEEVERAIGITTTRCATREGSARPVALMKWSFDDYIAEELLPEEAFVGSSVAAVERGIANCSSSTNASSTPHVSPSTQHEISYVLLILSEGVPDTVVEKMLRERLPNDVVFHFLAPVDFVSCATRHVWLRCSEADAAKKLPKTFWGQQRWHAGVGDIYVSAARAICVDPMEPSFPPMLLPRTRYTVTLRNIQSSLGDVLPPLQSVARNGFLNYSHVARHGVGLSRVYADAMHLLHRDYPAFLRSHLQRLTEGTPQVQRELPLLLELVGAPRSSASDWRGSVTGLEAAVRADAQVYGRTRQSGLYPPHHGLLLDLVSRAADTMPRHHDTARLLREAVRPLVLQETLRAITDVHFNAFASLRWQRDGERVAVGDLVRVPRKESDVRGAPVDRFMGPADHIHGAMTSSAHQHWSSLPRSSGLPSSEFSIKHVSTKSEALHYDVNDVVLPTFGRGIEVLLSESDALAGADLFFNLVRELRVEGLSEMQLAPLAAFRPLIQRPQDMSFYLVDEKRGWDWEEDAGSTALKKALYHDQDGVLRYRSPLAQQTGKNMVARIGIRGDVARNFFLKPARKPGITCIMQMTLPAGCHATSAIREAFMLATVSPSAIFRLLAR